MPKARRRPKFAHIKRPEGKPMPMTAPLHVTNARAKVCATGCDRGTKKAIYSPTQYQDRGRHVNYCNEMGVPLHTIIHMVNPNCPLKKW